MTEANDSLEGVVYCFFFFLTINSVMSTLQPLVENQDPSHSYPNGNIMIGNETAKQDSISVSLTD